MYCTFILDTSLDYFDTHKIVYWSTQSALILLELLKNISFDFKINVSYKYGENFENFRLTSTAFCVLNSLKTEATEMYLDCKKIRKHTSNLKFKLYFNGSQIIDKFSLKLNKNLMGQQHTWFVLQLVQ